MGTIWEKPIKVIQCIPVRHLLRHRRLASSHRQQPDSNVQHQCYILGKKFKSELNTTNLDFSVQLAGNCGEKELHREIGRKILGQWILICT